MALRNTILRGVDTAFSIANDLAVDVTFNPATSGDYNFSNQSVEINTGKAVTIRGLIIDDKKEITDGNNAKRKLLVKTADMVGNIDTYSTFNINNNSYALKKYEDNGYVIEIEMRGVL
jgi:hypothetical protein